ncbi:DNA damage-inducible protein YebG [Escherichia coli]|nr:DNA damage-inducible protein YebG [Escherichia coli]
MAVEVKYVVIREGEEKMSFTSKRKPMLMIKCLIRRICLTPG